VALTLLVLFLVFFDSVFFARPFGLQVALRATLFVVRGNFRVMASYSVDCL